MSSVAVLVLDPDPTTGTATVEFLEREHGLDATLVAEPETAHRRATEADPDCLVVATSLDREALVPLLDALREDCPDLPVVLFGDREIREVSGAALADRLWTAGTGADAVTPLADCVAYAVSHRRMVEALRGEGALLRSALDTVDQPFFVLDTDGRLAYWNDAVRRVTGRDDEDLAGTDVADLVAAASREEVTASVELTLETGQSVVEANVVVADGSVVPFEISCARLTDDEGAVLGVCATGTDVRERREREEQLAVLHRILRHNVRNSVNAVLGWTEEVESAAPVPDRYVTPIKNQTDRLLRVAEQTRTLSELVADKTRDRRPVDVAAVVRDELHALPTDVDVEATLPESETALADELLNVAVRELLANAVERGPARTDGGGGRSLVVEVAREAGQVWLSVTDDGPSMNPDQRAAFVDGTETPLAHADGLGLWVVKWVVTRSGGTIDVEELGDGVRVSVVLPAA